MTSLVLPTSLGGGTGSFGGGVGIRSRYSSGSADLSCFRGPASGSNPPQPRASCLGMFSTAYAGNLFVNSLPCVPAEDVGPSGVGFAASFGGAEDSNPAAPSGWKVTSTRKGDVYCPWTPRWIFVNRVWPLSVPDVASVRDVLTSPRRAPSHTPGGIYTPALEHSSAARS